MEDQRIGDLLRELPRERARPGFTSRVLAAALDSETRTAPGWRPVLAAAAIAAVAVSAGFLAERQASRAEDTERLLRELRAEHGRLEEEFQELAEPPVLYLGGYRVGDGEVDYVLDLSRVPDGVTIPASYNGTI
jgi:hypothetical protein